MKTPAGHECRHYYEDFNRGRNRQECRLLKNNHASLPWKPSDCNDCPVPGILWANASPDLELTARVQTGFLGMGRHVEVQASCRKHGIDIKDPHVGCRYCAAERPNLDVFFQEGEE